MFYKEIPEIPRLEEQFVLADDSPSGLRYWLPGLVSGTGGPVAGTPCTTFYPGEEREQLRHQHLWPMNFEVHVQTGWKDIMDLGFGYDIDSELRYVPAEVVREHLQLVREIQLLTAIVKKNRPEQRQKQPQHRGKTVYLSPQKQAALNSMSPSERSIAVLREI
ncbi:Uncharacterised protein [Serratia ficaria]|uniref:hypothetical protein n=1 Tax=Serratia ficaria TaxID=61651 RepID=UPI0021793550|nr:hypothetical protein [Serratia ficaria]CAI1190447.1 Uncharacterised protein [Serratia ficaria]CAI2000202.1 Uncharacterised protein [Serratia ficaria]CAI2539450.1 Uncharacterised protein [Serratia ficaria]